MIGIDLFCGAGGMTLGAKFSGIDVLYAIENDKDAAKTYQTNNDDVILLECDIREIKSIPVSRNSELVVFGGPPCQGFSTSNQRTRNKKNPNNWLFKEFIRLVRSFKPLPDWVVFENVKGFSETENGEFLNEVFEQLAGLGYCISHSVLNAADFGIPQKRSRFFAIGSLHGKKISFPSMNSLSPVTVKQAIEDLPSLANGDSFISKEYRYSPRTDYVKLLRGNATVALNNHVTRNSELVLKRYTYIPQGGNWEDIPDRLMKNYKDKSRCHTGIYHRLNEDEPSIVIGNYRKNMLIHPWENRGLSVREAARLQSFPDWYVFEGSIGFQQQQVGNAVPPLLAREIFSLILNQS